jgi:hypothetical protein
LKISYRALIYKIRNNGLMPNGPRRGSVGQAPGGTLNREAAPSTD